MVELPFSMAHSIHAAMNGKHRLLIGALARTQDIFEGSW